MNKRKRKENEKKFSDWKSTSNGRRIYWRDVKGKMGWKAKYLKEVDEHENTLRFWQEIYDEQNNLVEIHEKYPHDRGHKKL